MAASMYASALPGPDRKQQFTRCVSASQRPLCASSVRLIATSVCSCIQVRIFGRWLHVAERHGVPQPFPDPYMRGVACAVSPAAGA